MTFKEIVIAQAVREAKSFINDFTQFTATAERLADNSYDVVVSGEETDYLSIIVMLQLVKGEQTLHALANVMANESGLYVSRYTCDNHTTTLYNPYEFVQLLNEMGE